MNSTASRLLASSAALTVVLSTGSAAATQASEEEETQVRTSTTTTATNGGETEVRTQTVLTAGPNAAGRDATADGRGSDDDTDAWRLGVVGGIGFPRPLMLEGLLKIERVVGLGIEYSLLPKLGLGGVETTFWALAADLRVFPFQNGFFVGLRGGYQRIAATTTIGIAGLGSFTESATGESVFLNPRIGFLWTWKSGFTIGIDAGVQLPVSASVTSTIPSGLVAELDSGIQKVANTLGHEPTPTVDLLRVGFLF